MMPVPDRRGTVGVSLESHKCLLYQVYGLTVLSEVVLPELTAVGNCQPDVEIRFGEVPQPPDSEELSNRRSWSMASSSEFIFSIKGVAKYHIANGRSITIDRRLDLTKSVRSADLRLWLLGSAFGALLHQRGLLPLHVSAVKAPSGVWAFTGESGEGKSTLAGYLNRRFGWELVSDDVSVIDPKSSEPVIYPGPRKLKLWADALAHMKFTDGKILRDLSNTEKFQVYLSDEGFYEPESLRGLIVLKSVPEEVEPNIERLRGVEALRAFLDAVYRPRLQALFKAPEQRVSDIVPLCQSVSVYRFCRPRSLVGFESQLRPLLRLIAGAGA